MNSMISLNTSKRKKIRRWPENIKKCTKELIVQKLSVVQLWMPINKS